MKHCEATPEERALFRAIAGLAKHFEVVQILVSRHEPATNKTTALSAGIGNAYARIGHVQDWLHDQSQDPEPPDAGVGWKN